MKLLHSFFVACVFLLFGTAALPLAAMEGGEAGPELIWVATRNDGSVVAVAPEAARPVAEIALPAGRAAQGLAAAPDALWVTDTAGHVYRIDPAERRITASGRASTHADQVVASTAAVWVSNGDLARISRIDAATASVVDTVEIGWWVLDVARSADTLWIASDGDRGGQLSRMPFLGNRVVDRIELDWRPEALATGMGSIWVHDSGFGAVHRFDAASGAPQGRFPLEAEMYEGQGVAFGFDALWVALGMEEAIAGIDPATGAVIRVAVPGFVQDVAAGAGSVWGVLPEDDLLVRIDPNTLQVSARVRVPGYPIAVEVQ